MNGKVSKTKLAFVLFLITLVSTLSVVFYMQSYYHSSYTIYVSKLSEKPAHYFVLENPDVYVLEAMSSQNFVTIGSPEATLLDDLLTVEGTSHFEYNDNYYGAGYGFETKTSPVYMFLFIFGITAVPSLSIAAFAFTLKKRICAKKQFSS